VREAERASARELRRLFSRLRRHHDSGSWWPARTRFEMMAGAVLTQRTRWESAATAAARLRRNRLLSAERLLAAGPSTIAALLRPCGDHRTKAARLVALAQFVRQHGGPAGLARWPTDRLRGALLDVPGIGPETADVILLYAFGRPAFVADTYALRWLGRIGWLRRAGLAARYAVVHRHVTVIFGGDQDRLAVLHAVIVEHGKALCGARPRCQDCFLAGDCDTGRGVTGSRRPSR
jgi:endonuclease-3 related protein